MARSLVTLETLERYLRLSSLNLVAVLTLCMLGNCVCFFCRLVFFSSQKLTFSIKSFRSSIGVPKNLDPDRARHFVGPDLVPNCLQRLTTEAI